MEGLWPGVAAIKADADLYCVSCAKRLYGKRIIQAVIDATPGYERYTDHERNPFGVVLRTDDDLKDYGCGKCGTPLDEEESLLNEEEE